MQAIDLIRTAMQWTDEGMLAILDGMQSAPLTQPTSKGGNHPLWTVGHLAVIEGNIPAIIHGTPHPLENWKSLFAAGTTPVADASKYPAFDVVLAKYRELRQQNLKLLDELGEAGLEQVPKAIPPGFEETMRTVGHTLLLLCLHQMVHYGQVADARRVAGLLPLL